jgi:hypothetical protein
VLVEAEIVVELLLAVLVGFYLHILPQIQLQTMATFWHFSKR